MPRSKRYKAGDKTIKAADLNRVLDASDKIIREGKHTVSPAGGKGPPPRFVVTMKKKDASQEMLPGHAVTWSNQTVVEALQAGSNVPQSTTAPTSLTTYKESFLDVEAQKEKFTELLHMTESSLWEKFECELTSAGVESYGVLATAMTQNNCLGYVTEGSKGGQNSDDRDETVQVCIGGVALALVRVFKSHCYQIESSSEYESKFLIHDGFSVGWSRRITEPRFYPGGTDLIVVVPGVSELIRGGTAEILRQCVIENDDDTWPVYCYVPIIV